MKSRLNIAHISPGAYRAMAGLETYIHSSSIEEPLVHLLKMRVSQINGCAYCLDMHSKDARALGETEQRLYGLNAWREAPYYSDRERAALAFVEAITLVADTHVEDEVYDEARKVFNEQELVDLAMIAVAINGWNRLAITFRAEAGTYEPKKREAKIA